MSRHTHTRLVATLLATALIVGAVAAPAAAGLPDPPDRPNQHGAKSGVGDVYDGSVFVLRTTDETVTEKKAWTFDCDGEDHTVSLPPNEYGTSVSGPLGGAAMNGVKQAAGDLRPEKQDPEKRKMVVDTPDGNGEVTVKAIAEYRHVDYDVYVQRQAVPAKNELVGYVHRKTLEGYGWAVEKDCKKGGKKPPVKRPDRNDGNESDGPPPRDGKYPFQSPRPAVEPLAMGVVTVDNGPPMTERSANGGGGHADDSPEYTGFETADEAAILLSERFRNADVPGVAKGAIADKRLNVEIDGGTVGVRTNDEGIPVSVRTQPYEDPDGTVTVDEATLRELERADNPEAAARTAIRQGRIEYSTNSLVRQAGFYTVEAGLHGASFGRDVARGVGSFVRGVTPGR